MGATPVERWRHPGRGEGAAPVAGRVPGYGRAMRKDAHPDRPSRPVVLLAPDKFRGSLTAREAVAAARLGAQDAGWEVIERPLSDGGEGLLDALGGANRTSRVTGPDGTSLDAAWRLDPDGTAVVESALASGLAVAGGRERNDPLAATSAGTGELVAEAVLAGATRVVVGLGGSACTDGGYAAVQAVLERLGGQRPVDRGVELVAACDVRTRFTDAARVFGPQKGAGPEQVAELTARLQTVLADYLERFGPALARAGVDLPSLPGAGAAGGLGGAVVALGGRLVPGLELVAGQVGLDDALAGADAVVTGEGALDAESFHGKVVGGVVEAAQAYGIPVVAVAGVIEPDAPCTQLSRIHAVDLSETYGEEASWTQTAECLRDAVREALQTL